MSADISLAQSTNDVVKIKISEELGVAFLRSFPKTLVPVSLNVEKDYTPSIFSGKSFNGGLISPEDVHKKILLSFTVINDQDESDSFYFFPGFYFSKTFLYKIINDKAVALPVMTPDNKDSISFRQVPIMPHETIHLLAECYPVKTYTNSFRPRLIDREYINGYIAELQLQNKFVSLLTYIFCGLMALMVLFSLASFIQERKTDFLYYAAYAFFLGYMLFTKQYYNNRSYQRNFFYEEYMDFILQSLGICFYMAFMIRFLETRRLHPFLHRLYLSGIAFLMVVLPLYTFLHYGTDNYYFEYLLENYISKGVLLAMLVVFLIYAGRRLQNKLMRYLFWGNFFYLFFSLYSLATIIIPGMFRLSGLLGNSLVLYEIGLILELIFFLLALTFKNRSQLVEQVKEGERLKMEKQMAVMQAHQEERQRISADIHDELGSGMTTIRLMSEIAKQKMKENVPVEIEKISNSANDLLNKMNAIVWSMISSNDTVDSLVSYIRAYAIDFFDGTPIHCRVDMPAEIPAIEISGDKRRNIFLCVKETLNNTLKHSGATEVTIVFEIDQTRLKICITDNGVGMDPDNTRKFGHGLKNIMNRIHSIGGAYTITGNKGAKSCLELPL
jgi:signal transduction histidine kinase